MFDFDFCFPKAAEAFNSKMTGWRSSELIGYEMWSLMQKNCSVLITKHQSPKSCQHFLLFLFVICLWICQVHYRKIRVTCCVRCHHEKSILNIRIRRHPFVPYLSGNVLTKFHGKLSSLHTLLIRWNVSLQAVTRPLSLMAANYKFFDQY